MKKLLGLTIFLLLSCNKIKDTEQKTENKIKNNTTMDLAHNGTNETLISGLNLDNSLFEKNDIDLKKYKYNGIYIENIKISDLLQKEYRDRFFSYLENSISGEEDNYQVTLFTDLLMMRIDQFEDKNAYFLLKESSKNPSISYKGIEFRNQYLWDLFLDKASFFITESSKYNDTEILEFVILDMAKHFLKTEAEIKDPIRICYIDNLEAGLILLEKEKLEKVQLREFKEKFKLEKIIEIDCSPTFETRQNTTEEYYDIKSVIDKEMESKLGLKEKIFYKVRVVPILKEYILQSN